MSTRNIWAWDCCSPFVYHLLGVNTSRGSLSQSQDTVAVCQPDHLKCCSPHRRLLVGRNFTFTGRNTNFGRIFFLPSVHSHVNRFSSGSSKELVKSHLTRQRPPRSDSRSPPRCSCSSSALCSSPVTLLTSRIIRGGDGQPSHGSREMVDRLKVHVSVPDHHKPELHPALLPYT